MAAALAIVKAILGGIGGGFNGAKDGMGTAQVGSTNTDHSSKMGNIGYTMGNMGADKMSENANILGQLMGNKSEKGGDTFGNTKAKEDAINNSNSYVSKGSFDKSISSSGSNFSKGNMNVGKGMSDCNLKEIYGENIDDKIIENFAKISAIDFSYKQDAQKEYCGSCGVDNKEHIGVIAQELETNPATKGTVSTNSNGDKVVDTTHLTFADTAAIGELARRVLALEEEIKRMNGGC